jgi:hypothetical protein
MSSEDFRLIKPVPLTGAVPFSRPSPKWVYDRTGTLVQVPANTLGVTYDPADLSKAPWALLEPAATNIALQSEAFDDARWGKDGVTVSANAVAAPNGTVTADKLVESLSNSGHYVDQTITINGSAQYTRSVFVKAGERGQVRLEMYSVPTVAVRANVSFDIASGTFFGETSAVGVVQTYVALRLPNGWWRIFQTFNLGTTDTSCFFRVCLLGPGGASVYQGDGTSGAYVWGAMMGEGSYIATTSAPVTRAADVVGAGAGLVYSNVPITEPLWVTGTYAQGARVRDAANFVFESLADGNTSVLSEKTKWLPLGITNRLKMFDKAVNSQTVWPEEVVVVVKAAQLANTLTLLNVIGASVSVSQSESTYSRARSLVSHDVLSWYDFWYQEPLWIGDVVFDDLPPYIESVVTVAVRSPSNQAAVGGFFLGKSKFIGKTQWGLTAGILSYSGATADTFGNVTLMKRDSAKKMNFEVAIPRGYEDEVYRYMKSAENTEMVAIASTNWSMTISYGYLGQWELPLSIDGKKMPVEWRGLI